MAEIKIEDEEPLSPEIKYEALDSDTDSDSYTLSLTPSPTTYHKDEPHKPKIILAVNWPLGSRGEPSQEITNMTGIYWFSVDVNVDRVRTAKVSFKTNVSGRYSFAGSQDEAATLWVEHNWLKPTHSVAIDFDSLPVRWVLY